MRWLILLMQLLGVSMVVFGVGLVYMPAAVILAGVTMLAAGLLWEQSVDSE